RAPHAPDQPAHPAAVPAAGTGSAVVSEPIALTVAGGGMTRLRTRGAALRNSLYQLTNGYVTMAQTVKARPGTFRAAELDDSTKGLVFYKDTFHTFSNELVDVPDGYICNVLSSPAPVAPATSVDYALHTSHHFLAPTNIGYSDPTDGNFGTLVPGTID